MAEYSRQIRTPEDNYEYLVKIAEKKVKGPVLHLFLKAILGGWFAGLGGHAAFVLAASYYKENGLLGTPKVAFGLVFTSALLAIIFTGTDLYTGNTMSFTFTLYKKRIDPVQFGCKILVSLFGNYVGAVLAALILSGGTGYFTPEVGPGNPYMKLIAKYKTQQSFWRVICSGIGCNCFVCLAVWSSYVALDAAGSILAIVILITSFAVGGLEHIIANFYTLHACWISQTGITFVDVYFRNFLPTFIGNTIAGSLFLGLPLSILYGGSPKVTEDPEEELLPA
ncbi:formate/nitrate transporter, putative [Theileria equi strain WA]|uniref:Formate-nitrite transporter n=1 Tax=Theileria equi strain WA TaxID=1537102 RepID=L1LDY0_THEEQ|nr:formate/nitrate transporter, putative [Theileria equi strain WA]EKX73455.1 formate/nitrate transporter, putative [Theileria equi strain WA]|eukprot:XP_004832907.1 formate/nitrate transporter, putative [Theileria equi strain WA]